MIGIDTVEIERIKEAMGKAFCERIYTESERAYLAERKIPDERAAGMFAVKEAVSKALGTGISSGVTWQDIEVSYTQLGAPVVTLHGKAKELLAPMGQSVMVSVTHTDKLATAIAIIK